MQRVYNLRVKHHILKCTKGHKYINNINKYIKYINNINKHLATYLSVPVSMNTQLGSWASLLSWVQLVQTVMRLQYAGFHVGLLFAQRFIQMIKSKQGRLFSPNYLASLFGWLDLFWLRGKGSYSLTYFQVLMRHRLTPDFTRNVLSGSEP